MKPSKKKERCGHCRKVATRKILWADGRSYWATCSSHVNRGLASIKKNGKWAEIVCVYDYATGRKL